MDRQKDARLKKVGCINRKISYVVAKSLVNNKGAWCGIQQGSAFLCLPLLLGDKISTFCPTLHADYLFHGAPSEFSLLLLISNP